MRRMPIHQFARPWLCLAAVLAAVTAPILKAAEQNPAPPRAYTTRGPSGEPRLVFPYPGAQQYHIFSSGQAGGPYVLDTNSGYTLGPTFVVTNPQPGRFYQIGVTPMATDEVFNATVLNRLTYGPTPDDIDRIRSIGASAFIAEQMAASAISDDVDTAPQQTNSLPPPPPLTNWIRVSATGTASGNNFGIFLSTAGRVYIDNVVLVTGTNADVGQNLLVNGDFEVEPITNGWSRGSSLSSSGTVITNSPTTDGQAASGARCALLTASSGGSGTTSGLWQQFATNGQFASTQRFTLSFSYLPVQNSGTNVLTVRLSGSVTATNVVLPTAPLPPPPAPPAISPVYARLTNSTANLDDIRAWQVFRAINSKRQLHEVLAQFFQNHLTTQYQKTKEFFDQFDEGSFTNETVREWTAVDLHWREHQLIRQALLNPNCNFYDLLKISIESPAMIIYLDTQLNSRNSPNQNYAREIMELHSMGADNGYIQQDIVDLARVWTGWRVDKKDPGVANNPFAAPLSRTNVAAFVDAPGQWVLHYNPSQHDTNTKRLFTNAPIAARFGAQFGAGQSYALILSNFLATGTNGFAEGYRVARHLADLPYTMEFVSVKLCRLFVHDGFEFGVYDYTAPNLAPEVQLVKDCMTAWNTPGPDGRKGHIRSVLNVIFNSELFRGHGASHQKVKTPLEFAVSAVRALRMTSSDSNGWVTATASSDGYGISGRNNNSSPLSRMGGMGLFNRAEPDGFSEFGRVWLNTANLAERMRFAQHLMMANSSSTKNTDYGSVGQGNRTDPVRLIQQRLSGSSRNDAAAVVDMFLGLLYPGEGAGNLGRDRQAAIDYLNSNDTGVPGTSPFASLSGAAYEARVRSMVGFLLSLPRFQEQ
jgi:uncharacterized protein (DUF1800 family)